MATTARQNMKRVFRTCIRPARRLVHKLASCVLPPAIDEDWQPPRRLAAEEQVQGPALPLVSLFLALLRAYIRALHQGALLFRF